MSMMTRDQAITQLMASAAKLSAPEVMIEALAPSVHILPHGTVQALVETSINEADLAERAAKILQGSPL